MYYVAIDIGCLECGEESHILGIFKEKEKAEKVCKDHKQRQNDNWTGQHNFEVQEIEEIDKEYKVNY